MVPALILLIKNLIKILIIRAREVVKLTLIKIAIISSSCLDLVKKVLLELHFKAKEVVVQV